MKNIVLYELLKSYVNKTINDVELQKLNLIVKDLDDKELSEYLSSIWNEFEIEGNPNEAILQEIKCNIDRKFDNSHKQMNLLNWVCRIAAILLIPVLITYFIKLNDNKSFYTNPTVVETNRGQQAKITLPDGSKVDLNSGSTLKYPSTFTSDNRVVNLSGEGFFDVSKDEMGKNFIVKTEYLDIEVLGTKFDVNTNNTFNYKEKGEKFVEVALLTGHVKASTKGQSSQVIDMIPNQKLILDKQTGEVSIKSFDPHQEIAWTKNQFIFHSAPLEDVFLGLEEKFGMTITIDNPALKNDLFTGTFKANSIVEIMDVLAIHYQFTYTLSNDTLKIKTK